MTALDGTPTGGAAAAAEGDGGSGDGGAAAPDWHKALAGDNAERLEALKGFDTQDALFAKLNAAPAASAPDDWRKTIAGDDPKVLKDLERVTDLPALYKLFSDNRTALRESGRVKLPGDNATEAELADYAKTMGIPDKPDGYEITAKPPEGLEIGDTDKAMLGDITARLDGALRRGAKPAQIVNLAHEIVYDLMSKSVLEADDRAAEFAVAQEDEARKVWRGGEYDQNLRLARAAIEQFGGKDWKAITEIRLADGGYLGDSFAFQSLMAGIGRTHGEDEYFLRASSGGGFGMSLDDEYKTLMAVRLTDPKLYNSPAHQEKLTRVIQALERHKEVSAAR